MYEIADQQLEDLTLETVPQKFAGETALAQAVELEPYDPDKDIKDHYEGRGYN